MSKKIGFNIPSDNKNQDDSVDNSFSIELLNKFCLKFIPSDPKNATTELTTEEIAKIISSFSADKVTKKYIADELRHRGYTYEIVYEGNKLIIRWLFRESI